MMLDIVSLEHDAAFAVRGVEFDLAKLTLKEARLQRDEPLSANELANRAKTYASTILDIESERVIPRMATIRKIATALGMNPRDIAWPGDPFGENASTGK